MRPKHFVPCALVLLAIAALPQAARKIHPQTGTQAPAHPTTRMSKPVHDSEDEGERIFQQNCSRCHAAPDAFSPRISGTIVRHMRVRASLSQHEEEELLRFFNP